MKPGWTLRIVVGLIAALLVVPTLILIPMSFSSGRTFAFPPSGWSLKWYHRLFESSVWRGSLSTTFQVTLIATPVAVVIGTAAAFGIARMGRRTRGVVTAGVLAPLIVPQILVALSVYGTYLQVKLNGTVRGLVLADTVIITPFVVIAVLSRLRSHDARLRDAALSLGARPAVVFYRVTLPMILPGILTGAALAFISAFDEFIIALLLQGPGVKMLSVQMYDSVALEIDPTISAASSILVVVISSVVLTAQLFATREKKAVPTP
jgi:ABC-type spermidine/putrescine transport system permease subunit II